MGKVFLAAFLGTHVPLLALLVYFVRRRRFVLGSALRGLSVTVPATLGGTALTLWAMYALSELTALASRALRRYLETGELFLLFPLVGALIVARRPRNPVG